jgi:hypothetical protein
MALLGAAKEGVPPCGRDEHEGFRTVFILPCVRTDALEEGTTPVVVPHEEVLS